MMDLTNAFMAEYSQLKGKTIKRIVVDNSDHENVYGLLFTDGTIAWILCDPEGNGPGFLEIRNGATK